MGWGGSSPGSSSPKARPARVSYWPAAPKTWPPNAGDGFVSTTIRFTRASVDGVSNPMVIATPNTADLQNPFRIFGDIGRSPLASGMVHTRNSPGGQPISARKVIAKAPCALRNGDGTLPFGKMKPVHRIKFLPLVAFVVGLLQGAPASSKAQSRTAQQSATFFKAWRDPREDAFRIGVPVGWRVSGGIVRLANIDVRPVVRAESPGGTIR